MKNHLCKPSSTTFPNYGFVVLLALIICSCSKDGVGPDWAGNIAGTWKSEIKRVDDYRTQAIYEIVRKDDKSVEITIRRTVWPKLESDEGVYSTNGTISTAWMSKKNTLVFEHNLAAPGAPFCGIKGTGALAGNKLTVASSTVCQGEDPDPATEEFTRQ